MEPTRIIVAGFPRCGTTLVASVIASSPLAHFVTHYSSFALRAGDRLRVGWNALLDPAQRRVALGLARDEWLRLGHVVTTHADDFSTLDDLHRRIAIELGRGRTVVGHKVRMPVRWIQRTLEQTNIRVVVMIRDARAAALSYVNYTGLAAESYLREWKEMAALCLSTSSPRFTFLRYEDLVSDPNTELVRALGSWATGVERFSALQFVQGGLKPPGQWLENSAFGDVRSRIDTTPRDRWRSQTAELLVRYAAVTCSEELQQLGYRVDPSRWEDQLRFRLHEAYWRADAKLARAADLARSRLGRWLAPPLRQSPSERDSPTRSS
ncbi:MAG: sulfotransferase [Sandaracinaceae bacterium]